MLTIETKMDRAEVTRRLYDYIESQVYQWWDHGMTLEDCEDEGADTIDLSATNMEWWRVNMIRAAVIETMDPDFEGGFPKGGAPDELREEIQDRAESLVTTCFGEPPKAKKKKMKKKGRRK